MNSDIRDLSLDMACHPPPPFPRLSLPTFRNHRCTVMQHGLMQAHRCARGQ